VVDIRPAEIAATVSSFLFFFFVLSSYFILRPVRDLIAVTTSPTRLPWLFGGTLVTMLLANRLFSALVVRLPVRWFVPLTYHFFAANLLAFFAILRITGGSVAGTQTLGIVFYVWTSVYNLFITSVFWCFMADIFRSEQAKRLFGFIGVGGTLGSITGSVLCAELAERIGVVNLFLVSVVLLEAAAMIVLYFPPAPRAVVSALPNEEDPTRNARIGGSVWAGITSLLRSPYLLGVAGFQILYSIGSTLLYFEQAGIVRTTFTSPESRTVALAHIETAVQVLTVVTQIFLTGRIIRWFGLAATLALLPALSAVGFTALGTAPVFVTLVVFIVLRRGTNFGITNPAMEVLFTVVSREDKYKAKSFIETFVYRAGDQIGAWTYALFVLLGMGVSGAAYAAVPLALIWLFLGLWLGRRQAQLAAAERQEMHPNAPAAPPMALLP
jgi:AAA family ATP:ADP antiporter